MLPRLARFFLGLIVATIIWLPVSPLYNQLLARTSQPLLKIDRRFRDARVAAHGDQVVVTSAGGRFPPANIPASQLTYNIVFLVALFASNRRPLRDRNVLPFVLSLLIVAASHPISVVMSIESTYAVQLGVWSEQHYSEISANTWLAAEMFYRLIGMFALVFACWWWGGKRFVG